MRNAHFTEEQIGAINLEIALTNFFNAAVERTATGLCNPRLQ
ncbi:hypothetical protein GCM10010300_46730 [Streptomyces olivaceoviridis]|nr:hypothetical protein GCM10010300_46730 [Streptomyces olivaceoviridis]